MRYTFSTREKVLIGVFIAIILGLVWFVFVFQQSESQLRSLNSEIESTNSEILVAQTNIAKLNEMKAANEAHEAAGDRSTPVPRYDNTQPLMAFLNGVLGSTDSFSLTFDELAWDANTAMRGVNVTFGCNSYEQAEATVHAIAEGPYPCSIDSISVTDSAGRVSSSLNRMMNGSGQSSCSVFTHITFIEEQQ